MEKLYRELYRLLADLDKAEHSVEIENLNREVAFIEGIIFWREFYEN